MSADTIVPEPGNPQDLNRYAYVRNNPLIYVDPGGHKPWPPRGPGNGGDPWPTWVDRVSKKQREPVPLGSKWSGIGAYWELSGGANAIVGGRISPFTLLPKAVVFNWDSGELSFAWSGSIAGEIGTPKGWNGEAAAGLLFPVGYSNNDMILGESMDLGFGFGADLISKLGLDGGVSHEMEMDPTTGDMVPALDPETLEWPYMVNIGVSAGVDQIPNGVEASVNLGPSYTPLVVSYQVCPWKWPDPWNFGSNKNGPTFHGIPAQVQIDTRPLLWLLEKLQ